ncbi:MAG: M28 family peptidase [Gemmatimonadales bacterium]
MARLDVTYRSLLSFFTFLVSVASVASCQRAGAPVGGSVAGLERDLAVLAADSMKGRFTGTPEATAVANYLARRFAEVGAAPGVPGWLQPFSIDSRAPAVASIAEAHRPSSGANVVALVRGSDPTLRDEYVIVGAHYDHLGFGYTGIRGPEQVGQIHNGADDNASGAVALVAIARELAAKPPRRSVLFLSFAGEEFGLIGSDAYVKAPVVPLDRTVAMINLDMVGRLRNDRLLAFGSETATELPALLDSLNQSAGFDLQASGDGYGRSDQQSFYLAKKPVIHLFTDLHEDYHRPSDDAERINVEGLARVASFASSLARALADRRAPLTFVDHPPPAQAAAPARTGGYGAYLGSIPDMSGGGPGVRLSGVRPSSPADQAGLKEGDVLLKIGEHEVPDLQGMTNALRAHRPGDTVTVVFRRGAATDSTVVVLGSRGS